VHYLDQTFPTPAENLACDEALLLWREQAGGAEILRVWEPRQYFVVLGRGNKAATEVNLPACRERGIPILRRCSGGGAVLQGPGCLNYSLVLRIANHPALSSITQTNCFIMRRNAKSISSLVGHEVAVAGFTDLALENLKISGNAQRRQREWLLFHGTFLLGLDLELMQELLLPPSKQPDYRQNRTHMKFLRQLELPSENVKTALRATWGAAEALAETPSSILAHLKEKYLRDDWNLRS
jgi:lipoate---protein ligase